MASINQMNESITRCSNSIDRLTEAIDKYINKTSKASTGNKSVSDSLRNVTDGAKKTENQFEQLSKVVGKNVTAFEGFKAIVMVLPKLAEVLGNSFLTAFKRVGQFEQSVYNASMKLKVQSDQFKTLGQASEIYKRSLSEISRQTGLSTESAKDLSDTLITGFRGFLSVDVVGRLTNISAKFFEMSGSVEGANNQLKELLSSMNKYKEVQEFAAKASKGQLTQSDQTRLYSMALIGRIGWNDASSLVEMSRQTASGGGVNKSGRESLFAALGFGEAKKQAEFSGSQFIANNQYAQATLKAGTGIYGAMGENGFMGLASIGTNIFSNTTKMIAILTGIQFAIAGRAVGSSVANAAATTAAANAAAVALSSSVGTKVVTSAASKIAATSIIAKSSGMLLRSLPFVGTAITAGALLMSGYSWYKSRRGAGAPGGGAGEQDSAMITGGEAGTAAQSAIQVIESQMRTNLPIENLTQIASATKSTADALKSFPGFSKESSLYYKKERETQEKLSSVLRQRYLQAREYYNQTGNEESRVLMEEEFSKYTGARAATITATRSEIETKYGKQIGMAEANRKLVDAMASLNVNMRAGMGPQVELNIMSARQSMEIGRQQLNISRDLMNKSNNAKYTQDDRDEFRRQSIEARATAMGTISGAYEKTKSMREAYLDAVASSTFGAGAFSKMTVSRGFGNQFFAPAMALGGFGLKGSIVDPMRMTMGGLSADLPAQRRMAENFGYDMQGLPGPWSAQGAQNFMGAMGQLSGDFKVTIVGESADGTLNGRGEMRAASRKTF